MANNDNETVQMVDDGNTAAGSDETTMIIDSDAAEVPAVKTKKELKQERKDLKKHKKEVKKDAKRHSATTTKAERFWMVVLRLFVIVMMIACVVLLVRTYNNISDLASGTSSSDSSSSSSSGSSSSTSSTSTSNTTSTSTSTSTGSNSSDTSSDASDTSADTDSSGDNADSSGTAAGDLSTKEGIVEYYKTAYSNAISNASSATKYYDNTLNYNDYLDIGGNSTLESVAKTLMSTFMKEDTTEYTYTGSDIEANLPPSGSNVSGLTADMISEATCTEDGDNYIITLTINSTEDNYDTGSMTGNLVSIINEQSVTDAAGSLVTLSGLENRYIGATVTATVEKSTGNLINLETDVPSYMCFGEAKVLIVSVQDVSIGLEYLQKWRIEY
ncbi:MAG: hypothetical protein LUG85_03620 [Clostridiales bacterium]|nr:hypothetical protein [Clostridiales bacterium]MCD7827607.1 hypothetical protein [Clostridiales bacterium]